MLPTPTELHGETNKGGCIFIESVQGVSVDKKLEDGEEPVDCLLVR